MVKRFTYPAVLYHDNGIYAIVSSDLNIVSSGDTAEKAYEEMLDQLETFLGFSLSLEIEIPNSSKFSDMREHIKKSDVLLVSARIVTSKGE